ncbi:FAD/NAD(P)-binding protein [Sphingobacterium hungaricum]|uniref:FAD-dependent urate hydroxylase HpyO/Asp monooxygenase CreE-like FAD/NAD(P)-binding domain-containing protein n=1 Tax=Sphingobacterium hungaricum TaxID=2082723 RepID=A0A928YRM9_9SPHI|nr:FAD/NAD(P)-binding protein [Sphingobacterium hungaricum]MBE8715154.1 hypothetical protein [Sphingobacterium hungaricum]
MIWTSEHIDSSCLQNSKALQNLTKTSKDLAAEEKDAHYIAIIGGGPKGFYALERLIANLRKGDLKKKVIVHWFNNNSSFGAGQNYHIDQPNYLLINYCIGNITCWEDPDPLKFIDVYTNLTEWINNNKKVHFDADPEDFSSRELVGNYLMNAVFETVHYDIPNLEIHLIKSYITDLNKRNTHYVLYSDGEQLLYGYESILLATGHAYSNRSAKLHEHSINSSFSYFPSAYPIRQLDQIPAEAEVAVMGIGLTFIDVMLQLTEGRGGKFIYNNKELEYIPSGNECIIYPFSRNNLPMMPRNAILEHTKYQLKYMTDEWVAGLKAENRQIDFEKDILPVYNQEIRYAYYKLFFRDEALTDDELWTKIEQRDESIRLNISRFLNPQMYHRTNDNEDYSAFIFDVSNFVLTEVGHGELKSKLAAAAGACREGLLQIGKLYHFDGFLPASQEKFDRDWYSSLSRMSFGPPLINSQKLFALIKANIIRFKFEEAPELSLTDSGIRLSTPKASHDFAYYIDARIAKGSIKKGNNPLYKNLYERSIIEERFNGNYATDAIAITPEGKLKDKEDWVLTLYGTPTEGNVLDNDSLSRKTHNFGNLWAKETSDLVKN